MFWLTVVLHLFIGATLAGVGIVVALVTGHVTPLILGGAVAVGFLAAVPVARAVARAMAGDD